MANKQYGATIMCIVLLSGILVYIVNNLITNTYFMQNAPKEYQWIVHGFKNLIGYMTIFFPGYLTYKYIKKVNFLHKSEDNWCYHLIRCCFGEEELVLNPTNVGTLFQGSVLQESVLILIHFVGLQISYLTWGVLQEKIMTQKYINGKGETASFTDSQFLVFVNRILAFAISGVYLLYKRQFRNLCPLYKYSFCSFSNIMSSWCQYEALKYVSFPYQVIAKSAKTIPVMLMGTVISRTKYEFYEYVTSVILSIGMLLFMFNVENDRSESVLTTFSGALLLVLYIVFDSFTSNWQGALFRTYNMKPIQMMCFVNLFSCSFTAVSLFQQGAFLKSTMFMLTYPQFVFDCVLISVCSVSGQLFIFSTISKFGPLIFAIITTIRQGLSILLSCVIYNHHVDVLGVIGIVFVFVSVFLRIYCGHRLKAKRKIQRT